MLLHTAVEHEDPGLELELLIREARRRQRRRRLRGALTGVLALGVAGASAVATSGGWPFGARGPQTAARTVSVSAKGCPSSPTRVVSNSVFSAVVIGNGRVRLGIGNEYNAHGRIVVVHHGLRGWGGIEAIWWVPQPGVRGPVSVRGMALGGKRPIEVQASQGGQAPGTGTLSLSGPSDGVSVNPTAPSPGAVYPGSLWLRTGGCYAIDITGRGFRERLVFDVAMRAGPYRPAPGSS